MITYETLKELIVYISPIIAGFITSTVIPLLIKKFAEKKLTSKIEDACNKLDNHDERLYKELEEIKRQLYIMRGKAPEPKKEKSYENNKKISRNNSGNRTH